MSEPQRNIPAVTFPPPEPHQVNGEPVHTDVRFEPTDVDSRAVIWFVVGLAVALAIVMLILWGLFHLFLRTEDARKKSTFPVAVENREVMKIEERLPPEPRLEGIGPVSQDKFIGRMASTDTQPQHDVGRIRPSTADALYREQEETLSEYGWVEKDKVARIPIEEAMKRLLAKLPANQGESKGQSPGPPNRSSSGRVPGEGRP